MASKDALSNQFEQLELFDPSPYENEVPTRQSTPKPEPAAPTHRDLQMFMTGSEVMRSIDGAVDFNAGDAMNTDPHPYWGPRGIESMWAEKLHEAQTGMRAGVRRGRPIYDDIAENGVRSPITMYHEDSPGPNSVPGTRRMLHGDGHHRTAVAAHIEETTGRPVYLPVIHSDTDFMASKNLK